MITSPLVSICIPVYNCEKYINSALNSVLTQSYTNIEVIVVNDGSKDNTRNILKVYEDKGVIVIDQENRGQCAAANTAFKASSGEYIKFFDGDDILCKDFIKNQINKLQGRKDAIASAAWGRFYQDDLSTFRLNPEPVWKDMKSIEWLVKSLENGANMMQCGLWLIPREVLLISGLWDERLSLINDFDFFIRVILATQDVLFTEETILYYRSGISQSLSGQKSRKAMESALLSTKLGVDAILSFENTERTRKVCANALQLWKYDFFPKHKDLYNEAEKIIEQLGGSNFPFPSGGFTKFLSKIIGWKMAKYLKILAVK